MNQSLLFDPDSIFLLHLITVAAAATLFIRGTNLLLFIWRKFKRTICSLMKMNNSNHNNNNKKS